MTDNNTALKKAGLKVTLPRLKILEVLQEPDNHHVSAEDLYKRLIDMGEEIGLATVYRVLNQFDDCLYRDWETDRKSTRLNSSHLKLSRMPSSA